MENEMNLKEHKHNDISYKRVTIRMPRAPEVKNVVDGIARNAWTMFGIGTTAFAALVIETPPLSSDIYSNSDRLPVVVAMHR